MHNLSFEFCDRKQYYHDLIQRIELLGTGDRVSLQAISLDSREPLAVRLFQALAAAAQRKTKVTVAVDAYIFLMHGLPHMGPLWRQPNHPLLGQPLAQPFAGHLKLLEDVRRAGGQYGIINRPKRAFSLPYAGRSHIKIAVINDRVWLGGHNLNRADELDIMTSFEHSAMAGFLHTTVRSMISAGSASTAVGNKDRLVNFGPGLDLLIDAGIPGRSLILNEIIKHIDTSQEWAFVTCQYFPGGPLSQALRRALDRQVAIEAIFSHPSAHGNEQYIQTLHTVYNRLFLPSRLFAGQLPKGLPKMHAKLFANEKGAILGSHNGVTQGVRLGTAEIALRIMDQSFSRAAVKAIKEQY